MIGLYKAISTESGGWVEGFLRVSPQDNWASISVENGGSSWIEFEEEYVDPKTICRFWREWKGVKYFEGDKVIVKGTKRVGEYETFIVFNGTMFTLNENKTYLTDSSVLITIKQNVGNIHDV